MTRDGAIIVTTTRPGEGPALSGTVSAAEDSTYLAKAQWSGTAGDNLAYRISGDWRSTDGYYRNQFQGGAPVVDSYESWNVNARVLWEPTDRTTVDTKLVCRVIADITGIPVAEVEEEETQKLLRMEAEIGKQLEREEAREAVESRQGAVQDRGDGPRRTGHEANKEVS